MGSCDCGVKLGIGDWDNHIKALGFCAAVCYIGFFALVREPVEWWFQRLEFFFLFFFLFLYIYQNHVFADSWVRV